MNFLTRRAEAGRTDTDSRIRAMLVWVGLVGLGPLLLFFYFHLTFAGLTQPDAMDYAQIARNLSAGRGFCTDILRPLALSHGSDPLHQPDVTHGPLFPFALSLAMGALGAKDSVAAGVSGLFFLLSLPLVYRLGERVFGQTVSIIALLATATNAGLLQMAVSGLPLTLNLFLLTALMLALHSLAARQEDAPDAPPSRLAPAMTGLLTGLLYLADPLFVAVIPILLGLVLQSSRRHRLRTVLTFALPLVLVALPWMIRNGLLTGNPVFGLKGLEWWMGTHRYPGFVAYRLVPGELTPDFALFQGALRKMLENFVGGAPALFGSVSGPLLVFLIPSLLFRYASPAANLLRSAFLWLALGFFLTQLCFGVNLALFSALIPVLLVFAAAFLLHLARQAQMARPVVIWASALAVVVLLCPLAHDLWPGERPAPRPEADLAQSLKARSQPGDVCVTDQPWLVAWYADRPALWIAAEDAQTAALRVRFGPARWLFLTRDAGAMSPQWGAVYNLLARWDGAYAQAQTAGKPPLRAFQFRGSNPPILAALSGFGPVPPAPLPPGSRIAPPPAVLAEAPPAATPRTP